MYAKGSTIIILIVSMRIFAHGFTKSSFIESPGKRLVSSVIETMIVGNKIKCARACKNNPRCSSVNYKTVENGIECELNSGSDNWPAQLIDDEHSTFMCKSLYLLLYTLF